MLCCEERQAMDVHSVLRTECTSIQHNLSEYRPQQNITVRMMYVKGYQNKI
jgi:hypothetical protein